MNVNVTAETIHLLDDGTAGAAINQSIKSAIADTEDRGDDQKVRKVVVTLEFRKVSSRNVAVTCEVGTTTPKYKTGDTVAQLNMSSGKPALMFNAMSPDDPTQTTLDDEIDRNTRRKPKKEEDDN